MYPFSSMTVEAIRPTPTLLIHLSSATQIYGPPIFFGPSLLVAFHLRPKSQSSLIGWLNLFGSSNSQKSTKKKTYFSIFQ
jgi:hypothetical protein